MLRKLRNNNLPNILPKHRLKRHVPFLREQQILRQPLPIIPESLVQRIIAPREEPCLNRIEQIIFMAPILLLEE